MEFIAEFILELIFGVATEKKISKWIRYPLLFIVVSFCLAIIGYFIWTGIKDFETSKGRAIISWALAIFMAVLIYIGFIDNSKKFKKKKKLNKK